MIWSPADIADAVEAGVRNRCAALDAEHAVYGLDALDEIRFHPVVEESLLTAGFGVHREKRYPGDRGKRRESEGERCDFVLTPDARALQLSGGKVTLFEPPDAVPLDEAMWLECKMVCQYTPEGPNRNYTGQLLAPLRQDVKKLSKDPGILHAGLLVVLFCAREDIARHDMRIWQERCLEKVLPIGAPAWRGFDITDRCGNGYCAIIVHPVLHL